MSVRFNHGVRLILLICLACLIGACLACSQDRSSDRNTSASDPNAPACVQAVGPEKSKLLVGRCLAVSPATHPPCNAQNACALIIGEIKRSCSLLDERSAPAFCSEYR